MTQMRKQKHDKILLSFNDKVIADAVITKLSLSASNCCLEIFDNCSISGNGIFDKYGCYVTAISEDKPSISLYRAAGKNERIMFEAGNIKTLDGGQYDTAVIFNRTEEEIAADLSAVFQHLEKGGKAIILNTDKPLEEDSLKRLAAHHTILGDTVCGKEFSLLVIF